MKDVDCAGNHKPLWSVILLILAAVVIGGGLGYGQNEGVKSKNDTQDLRIENVEDDIGEIKDDLKDFRHEQRVFNSELIDELRMLNYHHSSRDDE